MGHPLGRLALLHPFPSALNAALVGILASVAGAPPGTASLLGLGMAGFQVSIGALNDLVDAPDDARVKPAKPIPAGLVSAAQARGVVVVGAAIGIAASAGVSWLALALGLAGYACGVAYDLRLKRLGIGWVAFTAAFPLLLLYGWSGGGGGMPPGWQALLPIAALAGPALHLANALTDLDDDLSTGAHGIATRLGRRRAVALLGVLTVAVQVLAWLVIADLAAGPLPIAIATLSTTTTVVGYGLTARGSRTSTAWGWTLQAIGVASLAVAWVAAAA